MEKAMYGLELTKNSKVGWAFSVSRTQSCVGKTQTCAKLCYGNGIRYGTEGQKYKRERNYRTAVLLLEQGGPSLLAENLLLLLEQARPIDWLPAKLSGIKTRLPYTLRLHDVGDFWSPAYIQAWRIAAEIRSECRFWFYTRSFLEKDMLKALTELAALPNCQGWLSADSDNYMQALAAYRSAPDIWKLSFLQGEPAAALPLALLAAIKKTVPEGRLVTFPYHRAGWHVEPVEDLFVCPQVLGLYPLAAGAEALKPCQQCMFCLP